MLLAVLLAAAISCAHSAHVEIFTCPDVPDEVIDELGPKALTWYMHEFDPWCEGLEAATDAGP